MESLDKQQLTLPVSLPVTFRFDEYVAGSNGEVLDYLRGLANGVEYSTPVCYLAGKHGLGKTHLLVATVEAANSEGHNALYLDLESLVEQPKDVLLDLEQYQLICVDNVDSVQNNIDWQQAIFDLVNRVLESNHQIVFAATALPKFLDIALADLVSRLEWGVLFKLQALPDELLVEAIIARAASKGLKMPVDSANYVIRHFRRDMKSLVAMLDLLDERSLQTQRRLTIPFIKDELNI